MKAGITLIFIFTLINLLGCSADNISKTKSETKVKLSTPIPQKPKPPRPNSPPIQDLQPDLHISGVESNHASGAISTSEHISGQ
jgi:hypothetical protein